MNAIWETDRRRVLVVVGTAPQPFTRLITWADAWTQAHPEDEVLVQHGFTTPPELARSIEMLAPDLLHTAVETANVVITHGGPGAISAVRRAGKQPLVLARNPEFGEMVDGHQMRFATWASARGFGTIMHSVDDLDAAVADASGVESDVAEPLEQIAASVERFRVLADDLLRNGPRRRVFPTLRRVRVDPGPTVSSRASRARRR